jgi:C_GCAxxG_C_C family probable redox protein
VFLVEPKIQAQTYFSQGYLCSQSILMAYGPLFNLERDMAARIAAPFGAGVARRGETCGAVSGACMVLGLKNGHTSAVDSDAKERTYRAVQEFISQFQLKFGSIKCSQLLELDISTPEMLEEARDRQLFTILCPGYVSHAAELLDKLILDE